MKFLIITAILSLFLFGCVVDKQVYNDLKVNCTKIMFVNDELNVTNAILLNKVEAYEKGITIGQSLINKEYDRDQIAKRRNISASYQDCEAWATDSELDTKDFTIKNELSMDMWLAMNGSSGCANSVMYMNISSQRLIAAYDDENTAIHNLCFGYWKDKDNNYALKYLKPFDDAGESIATNGMVYNSASNEVLAACGVSQ